MLIKLSLWRPQELGGISYGKHSSISKTQDTRSLQKEVSPFPQFHRYYHCHLCLQATKYQYLGGDEGTRARVLPVEWGSAKHLQFKLPREHPQKGLALIEAYLGLADGSRNLRLKASSFGLTLPFKNIFVGTLVYIRSSGCCSTTTNILRQPQLHEWTSVAMKTFQTGVYVPSFYFTVIPQLAKETGSISGAAVPALVQYTRVHKVLIPLYIFNHDNNNEPNTHK